MNLTDALTEYHYARDFTQQTRLWYDYHLRAFMRWADEQGVVEVEEVTTSLIRRYLSHLADVTGKTGKPLSSHTRHGTARCLRAFFNFCSDEGWVATGLNFRRGVMPKRDQKVIAVFTPKEIDSLLRACRDPENPEHAARDKAILTLLLDTGIRATELCTLELDRVTFSMTDAHIIVNGKGRKQREVGLGRNSRLALHRYIHELRPAVNHNFVFVTRYGTRLHRPGLEAILLKLQKRTGLEGLHVNPHKFRHTFAFLYMATKQGDMLRLSRLLGHTSVTVTENYLKAFGSQEARDGASVLDVLMNR